MMLDFSEVELKGPMGFFILPGQVHHYRNLYQYSGWFLAVEAELVGERFVSIFEDQRFSRQDIAIKDSRVLDMVAGTVEHLLESVPPCSARPAVLHSMIQSFTGLLAGFYLEASPVKAGLTDTHSSQLPARFRKLVAKYYLTEKISGSLCG